MKRKHYSRGIIITKRKISHIKNYVIKKFSRHPILELGSGYGTISKKFKVDLAIDFFYDNAKKYSEYIEHDLNDFPYPAKKKFNTILCFGTLMYIEKPNELINEVHMILNKGGYFILDFFDCDIEKYNNNGGWVGCDERHFYHKGIKAKQILDMLNKKFVVSVYYPSTLNINHLQPLWQMINHFKFYKKYMFVCRKAK